jgi:RNA polymerase-binding transcription factor DksA
MATKNKKSAAAASKAKSGKSVKIKPLAKKVVGTKKTVAKKAVKNTNAKKATLSKKVVSKLSKTQKSANHIKKQTPAKKAANAGGKKAAPKKLITPKNSTLKKASASTKKMLPKKIKVVVKKAPHTKKPVSAKVEKQKPVLKTVAKTSEKVFTDHKSELKKALAKVKAKKKEEEKKPFKVFVMPKTHTEKARKYQPEFTKSVLDQSPAENNGPTMRYSDSELMEFRELITRKLETAKKELGYLQGLITRKDQMGGDESDNRYMTMEDGSLSMEREQLSQMASRQITFIDHLEKAMMRIENKTYGICRVTGKLIDKARLRAVPHATLSIEAKMGIAK